MTDSLRDSLIRTYVPYIVGAVGGYTSDRLGWTDEETTLAVTLLVGGLYYLAVRALEQVWAGAGVLLLSRTRPMYVRAGRHEAGRRDDGAASARTVTTTAGAALCLLLAGLTAACDTTDVDHRIRLVPAAPVAVPFPGPLAAEQCGGILTVRHAEHLPHTRRQTPDPGRVTSDADGLFTGSTGAAWAWTPLKPSGPVTVELHHTGREPFATDDTWDPVPPAAVVRQVEREATVRLDAAPFDLVRVVASYPDLGRVASPGVPVTSGCVPGAGS